MLKTIEQSVRFSASARELYDLYIDPKKNAEFTGGGKVKISPKAGSAFSAFDGMLEGTTLLAVPGRMIVQRWKSCMWKAGDLDSTLVITFHDQGKHGRIDLVHVNVPTHDHAGVTQGWKKYYWQPLAAWLKKRGKAEQARLKVKG